MDRREFMPGSNVETSSYLDVPTRQRFPPLVGVPFEQADAAGEAVVRETRMDAMGDMVSVGQNRRAPIAPQPFQNSDFRNMVDDAFRLVAEQQRESAEHERSNYVQEQLPGLTPCFPPEPLPIAMPVTTLYMANQSSYPQRQLPLDCDKTEDLDSQRPSAFIAYAFSASHWPTILEIANSLRNSGIKVKLDAFEKTLVSQCRTRWYSKHIEESDFVIVCVDALYKYRVEQSELGGIQTEEDQCLADAIFVHNQLQTKYINNGCSNFNILPLIIDNAPFSSLPLWLQNTRVYSWPMDQDKLTKRIWRN